MKRNLISTFSMGLCVFVSAPAFSAEPTTHWSYTGKTDPTHWADGNPQNAACKTGQRQSPIALSDATASPVQEKDFTINYKPSTVYLVNNGHTIQANAEGQADSVTYKGINYKLAQFHFHTPSEHTLNGKRFPMELHLVNKGDDNTFTVIGVFVKKGKRNQELASVFSELPGRQTSEGVSGPAAQVDLAMLLPSNKKAFVYSGSLTTPPCSETVNWVVLEQPIEMSFEQINRFKAIFPDNHRPLQAVLNRKVEQQ
jgi:carbonic anhydrase